MSHKVTIDFEGLSIKVKTQCEIANLSLCKIDKKLNLIKQNADKLETNKVKEYESYLLKSKENIQNEINIFTKQLEEYKLLKKQEFDEDIRYQDLRSKNLAKIYNDINEQGVRLDKIVNDLTGSKLEIIDVMIDDELMKASQESSKKLLDKFNGVIDISKEKLEMLDTIDDVSLRELAYRELIKEENSTLNFDEILEKAKIKYNEMLNKKTSEVIKTYKNNLKSNGISTELLNDVHSIEEANEITNNAIVEEKVRKETLNVIIKAIRDRGFIVDTRKNLKIDRTNNIVKLVALKTSGQKAEFEIQLNGKFMYHFDGYDGLACNKDITPFMDDLKNIYDIKVLHEEVIWSNPDKIQTQKYQYVNKNKGKN